MTIYDKLGKGTRLKVKNDPSTYYNINVDSSKKFVFVYKGEDTSRIYRKSIANIVQIGNEKLS